MLQRYQRAALTHRTLDDARVYGPGYVVTDDEIHFHGTTYSNTAAYYQQITEGQPRPIVDEYIDRELTLLWGHFTWLPGVHSNWGHFIWTYLLRLAFTEPTPLLVSDKVPNRFLDWARAIGFTDFVKVADGVRIRKLHVPSVVCYRAANGIPAVLPSAAHRLRARLGVGLPPAKRTKVYVARGQSSPWRRLLNEEEVMAALTARGFTCISPERMTVAEQLAAMAAAEIVVSPMGGSAGITMFAPEDCKVVELSFPAFVGAFNGTMWADVFGQPYERVNGVSGEKTGFLEIDRDFTVSVEDVLAKL